MSFCWHDWYILKIYSDYVIKEMVKDPNSNPDDDDVEWTLRKYKEKICLKCGEYVDEITPRYEYHRLKRLKLKQKAAMALKIVSKIKLPDRPWRNK